MNSFKWLCVVSLLSCMYCYAVRRTNVSNNKIVNGRVIDITKIPHQAAVEYGGFFICAAVLIATAWLTGANHCFMNRENLREKIRIRLGSSYRLTEGSLYRINQIIKHPIWEKQGEPYDICAIELHSSIQPDEFKKPIPLTHPGDVPKKLGKVIRISGYGLQKKGPSTVLRYVDIKIVASKECERIYKEKREPRKVGKTLFCASSAVGAPCIGDSGGPAVYKDKFYGMVIAGDYCDDPNPGPSVYIKISEFVEWLRNVTKNYRL